MTEAEWLAAKDPDPLLDFLQEQPEPMSERKARLFAAACCRRVWDLLPNDHCRAAIAVIERYADGAACVLELASARASTLSAAGRGPAAAAAWAVHWSASRRVVPALWNVCASAAGAATRVAVDAGAARTAQAWNAASAAVAREQADLLREVFGNPFRTIALAPDWLAWHGGIVRKLALAIHDEEAFDRLPVLADALEEAGCMDAAILSHCRRPAEHVHGCWLVDLLLQKS